PGGYAAHRDENSEHTCRERSSSTHRQLRSSREAPKNSLMSRLPSVSVLMKPTGFPFFAGRITTLRISPGFMESLLMPSRVRFVTEAVVSFQSVNVPSLFG